MSKLRVWRSYAGAPPSTRAYVAARLANAPLGPVRAELGALRGRILSLGAGVAVVERFLTLSNPTSRFRRSSATQPGWRPQGACRGSRRGLATCSSRCRPDRSTAR